MFGPRSLIAARRGARIAAHSVRDPTVLELYHHGSSVCAAKVRFALAEKGVEVDRFHYVDILAGEQFTPEYRSINPRAVVPTLVHDGRVVTESTLICEYADEMFAGPALMPDDPYERYLMRSWTKVVDELLHPACADVTYVSCHRHIVTRLSPEKLEEFFASTPEQSVKGAWRERKRELVALGFDAPDIDAKFRLYHRQLQAMETALADSPWLAGDRFTLADIALAPYLNRLDMLGMDGLWTDRLPRVEDWFNRIRERPAFRPNLLDWCPDDLTRDLHEYGTQSWPQVMEILGLQ